MPGPRYADDPSLTNAARNQTVLIQRRIYGILLLLQDIFSNYSKNFKFRFID